MPRPNLSSQADLLLRRYMYMIRVGIRSKDTGTRSQDQRLPERDVLVLDIQLSADISPKVNSYSLHPRDKASQVPPRHQDSWLSTSTDLQPKDFRGPPGHIPNFQHALHTSSNKSQQQKQRLEGLGRHYLGTTEGDDTDYLQGNRKVGC